MENQQDYYYRSENGERHRKLMQKEKQKQYQPETKKRSDYGIEIFGYKCIVFIENMINKLFKKSENNN